MIRPVPDLLAVDRDVGRQRGRERRDPLRRGHLLAVDLGPQPGRAHGRDGRRELRRLVGSTRTRARLLTHDHAHTVSRAADSRCANTPDRAVRLCRVSEAASTPLTSAFMRAVRGEPVPHTPVWFMRQAGRSLPEYRKLREGVGMLESCMDADLVTEITLQPVRRYGVDAAILFSDIVLPAQGGRRRPRHQAGRRPGRGRAGADPRRRRGDPRPHPRARPLHHPGGRPAGRRARGHAADRLRRGAVHRGVVPRRGRAVPRARADQGDDVRRPGRLGRADAQDRGDLGRLPRGAGRGRRVGGPAVRLLGRRAHAGRLRGVRPAALGRRAGPRRCARRAPHPLRRRHREPARASWARPAATSSASTGGRRSAPPSARSATGPCRATSTRPWSSPRPR